MRFNLLIDTRLRELFEGIGTPERLKHGAQGSWSRRINAEHSLVYLVDGEDLVILQARYHCRAMQQKWVDVAAASECPR